MYLDAQRLVAAPLAVGVVEHALLDVLLQVYDHIDMALIWGMGDRQKQK